MKTKSVGEWWRVNRIHLLLEQGRATLEQLVCQMGLGGEIAKSAIAEIRRRITLGDEDPEMARIDAMTGDYDPDKMAFRLRVSRR